MRTKNFLIIILLFAVFVVFGTSCKSYSKLRHPKGVIIESRPAGKKPPGQMKKLTGEKSAKNYAPGQMKKKHKKRR
ncbi:MAG TPA: hypothetical protein DHV48_12250 [Prolixibacteraceae bacterium]|nr:MAG: hypothetical protein A2066_19460 [Bacteroidetes bacterium GWB2_41_8]HCY42107.1 hypothetical protein [Prolixibacteraceae bacterium]